MQMISLNCPSCGSPLEVNSELTRGTCNYCGCSFVIEDEIKKRNRDSEADGYFFEKGRIKAQEEQKEQEERQKILELEQQEKARLREETNKKKNAIGLIIAGVIIILILCFPLFFCA